MSGSTLKSEVLKPYLTKTFIETGTALGEGIVTALEAGFDQIISIEVNPDVFNEACLRFASNDKVMCVHGDSGMVLPEILKGIHHPCTFFLDAHWSTGEQDLGPHIDKCPILYDLRAIAQHEIKNHIILIDDIRYFRAGGLPQWHNVNLGDLMEVILNINSDYRIEFADGFQPFDILVAQVKEQPS